jgi:hypothetical protein
MTDELNLGDVGSDLNPLIWADGSPLDPAVPGDWARAAETVVKAEPGPAAEEEREPAFPERAWLPVLHAFVLSLWPVLGAMPLNPLIATLEQKHVALPGSDASPWQLWTEVAVSSLEG